MCYSTPSGVWNALIPGSGHELDDASKTAGAATKPPPAAPPAPATLGAANPYAPRTRQSFVIPQDETGGIVAAPANTLGSSGAAAGLSIPVA